VSFAGRSAERDGQRCLRDEFYQNMKPCAIGNDEKSKRDKYLAHFEEIFLRAKARHGPAARPVQLSEKGTERGPEKAG
jgi:hypothetical protein